MCIFLKIQRHQFSIILLPQIPLVNKMNVYFQLNMNKFEVGFLSVILRRFGRAPHFPRRDIKQSLVTALSDHLSFSFVLNTNSAAPVSRRRWGADAAPPAVSPTTTASAAWSDVWWPWYCWDTQEIADLQGTGWVGGPVAGASRRPAPERQDARVSKVKPLPHFTVLYAWSGASLFGTRLTKCVH